MLTACVLPAAAPPLPASCCLSTCLPAAGGRMIGKSVSNSVLDGWTGAFYEWEGDVKVCVGGVGVVGL